MGFSSKVLTEYQQESFRWVQAKTLIEPQKKLSHACLCLGKKFCDLFDDIESNHLNAFASEHDKINGPLSIYFVNARLTEKSKQGMKLAFLIS